MTLPGIATPDDHQKSLNRVLRLKKLPLLTRCSGCANTWTGALVCHCASCHRTFTGIRAFDIHRTGGICNDPSQVLTKTGEHRLIPASKPYWSGWGLPGEGWQPE